MNRRILTSVMKGINIPRCGVGGGGPSLVRSKGIWIVTVLVSLYMTPVRSVADRRDIINAARCRVRCLGNLQDEGDRGPTAMFFNRFKQSRSLAKCLELTECTACLKPCSQPYASLDLCQNVCEDDTPTCIESCQFLDEISKTHSGSCPRSPRPSPCTAPCDLDTECDLQSKCCPSSCGRTCQTAHNQHHGMPSIPQAPTIRERARGGSLELRWDTVHTNESGLILYIVDSKWNVGTLPSEAQATPWQQISQTTEQTTNMRDVTPGHWYQFRVEAVNLQGSRGPSSPTEPFRLPREPGPPGPPANLTEGDTLITEGRVAVTIKWLPPRKSDLPITRYRVFWNKKLDPSIEGVDDLQELRHVLPGDQLVFQIPGLEQDTTYFVQVQAVCHYGDSRLKSDKASVFITTYPLPRVAERVGSQRRPRPDGDEEVYVVPLPTPQAVTDIEVAQPYFHIDQMKANVSWSLPAVIGDEPHTAKVLLFWSPEVCIADDEGDDNLSRIMTGTTHDTKFTIHRLRFDCRYVVKVQSMSAEGVTGPVAQLSFPTPSCNEVILVGDERPDCPTSIRAPDEPPNLQHKFIISSSNNINASVSWGIPTSDAPLRGYRVVWGKVQDAFDPELDPKSAITKVLPKDQRSFSIGGLDEASTYVVQVRAMTEDMAGRVAQIHFTTPMLRVGPHDPPYKQATSGTQQVAVMVSVSTTTTSGPTPQPVGISADLTEQLPNSSSWTQSPSLWLWLQIVFVTLTTHFLMCHH